MHGQTDIKFIMLTVILPPAVYPTAVKYIIYHIISYHITYHIISYNISYHIIYHTISYHISYHITSYRIVSYHITSYRIVSYHIISYHHITSYRIISNDIISLDTIHNMNSVTRHCNSITRFSGLAFHKVTRINVTLFTVQCYIKFYYVFVCLCLFLLALFACYK